MPNLSVSGKKIVPLLFLMAVIYLTALLWFVYFKKHDMPNPGNTPRIPAAD